MDILLKGKASLNLNYYITATDADLGNNATVSFRIKNSPLRNSFAINKTDYPDTVSQKDKG